MRILVVDQEFLVAMEVERALTEAFACEVHIATPRDYSAELERQRFDIVVAEFKFVGSEAGEAAGRLTGSGAGLVFTTFGDEQIIRMSGWHGVPVVTKPFDEDRLVEAVRSAARNRAALA